MRLRYHSAARDGGFAFFGKRGCQEHDFLRRIDSRKKHVAADAADRFGKRAVVLLDEQALDQHILLRSQARQYPALRSPTLSGESTSEGVELPLQQIKSPL